MRNLDALIPRLCELARETGEERRRMSLRAAGLHALSTMVILAPSRLTLKNKSCLEL